jgi:hypothetical protein
VPSAIALPGDVLVVRTPGFAARMIRFGAGLRGLPDLDNHVAVMHHRDPTTGAWWCIQGQPGGVGWCEATGYLQDKYTITNWRQDKTDSQRFAVCKIVEALLHTPYDWPAIAADAMDDLRLPELWSERWQGKAPGHVVCSSLAAWAYWKAGLANPATDKLDPSEDLSRVQPADWEAWITARQYGSML